MQVLERKPSRIAKTPSNPSLGLQLTQRIARDFKPRWDQQWGGKFMLHGKVPNSNAIRLDGNDYLSVTGNPAIRRLCGRRSMHCGWIRTSWFSRACFT